MTTPRVSTANAIARVGINRLQREFRRARALMAGPGHAPSATELNTGTIRAAAARLGIAVEALPGGFLKLVHRGATSYSHGADFAFESLLPWHLCGDKLLTSTILAEHSIPVPSFRSFGITEYDDALSHLRASSGPLVAKPTRRTSGGEGVTMGITTPRALRSAFSRACAVSGDALLEAQVPGENVRITILDGEVVGSVHRLPAHVEGDGRSTITELITAKNERWRARRPDNRLHRPIKIDQELKRVLQGACLNLNSTPRSDETVYLREVCNADQGGEVHDIGHELHPDYVQLALSAAEVMGPVLSGVDLIARDFRAPATTGGVFVNEVNTTPALYVANAPVDGAPSTYAAERILRRLFPLDDGP